MIICPNIVIRLPEHWVFWLEAGPLPQPLCPAQKLLRGRFQSSIQLLWKLVPVSAPPCHDPSSTWAPRSVGISRRKKREAGRGFYCNPVILHWGICGSTYHTDTESHKTTCSRILALFTSCTINNMAFGGGEHHSNSQKVQRSLPWSKGAFPTISVTGCLEYLCRPMTGIRNLVVSNKLVGQWCPDILLH